jgi:short chain dehydrogenase
VVDTISRFAWGRLFCPVDHQSHKNPLPDIRAARKERVYFSGWEYPIQVADFTIWRADVSSKPMVQRREHGPVSRETSVYISQKFIFDIVVTGATDGIGREFALQLGKAGFNIFLASRSMDKLNAVAAELGQTFILCLCINALQD